MTPLECTMSRASKAGRRTVQRRRDEGPCCPKRRQTSLHPHLLTQGQRTRLLGSRSLGRTNVARILELQCSHGGLETLLHLAITVPREVPGVTAVLQLHAVGVFKVDGLGPVVVHHVRYLHAFGLEFLAFLVQGRCRARLKSKMVKCCGHA